MKKLIELLKQFDIKRGRQYPEYKIEKWIIYYVYHNPLEWDEYTDCTLNIISKKFWFIERLVDNDKIDNSKFYDKNILKWFMTLTKEEKADSIIMNLSISENPISDLISYLR